MVWHDIAWYCVVLRDNGTAEMILGDWRDTAAVKSGILKRKQIDAAGCIGYSSQVPQPLLWWYTIQSGNPNKELVADSTLA